MNSSISCGMEQENGIQFRGLYYYHAWVEDSVGWPSSVTPPLLKTTAECLVRSIPH